jgi:hypothetical protein
VCSSDLACYISLESLQSGVPITDTNCWALLCRDGISHRIPESTGGHSLSDVSDYNIVSDTTSQEFHQEMTDTEINKIINSLEFNNTLPETKTSHMHYACKNSDTHFPLVSKKLKWNTPIIFDKIINTGLMFDTKRGQIIFNKPGTYRVTLHINFTGVSIFKTIAYLMKPSDIIESEKYDKDRRILSSKMSLIGSSQVKNYLHYNFILKVDDALSTFVFMSVHKHQKNKLLGSEKELVIFGKEKTWILIECI